MGEPNPVRALIKRLEELDAAVGVERVKLADEIRNDAPDILRHEGDRGMWQATRPGALSRAAVARALGTTVPYVQKRASRYAGTRVVRKAEVKASK